ncbi:hypothetical protein vseg_016443 [Gypsophila vaccaria]
MDYPPSHVGHHTHRRHDNYDNDNDDNNYDPNLPPPPPPFSHPPPPSYAGAYDHAPPPLGGAYGHAPSPHGGAYGHAPGDYGGAYGHAPGEYGGAYEARPEVEQGYRREDSSHHRFRPHVPGFVGSHLHHGGGGGDHGSSGHGYDGGPYGPDMGSGSGLGPLENKPSYRIECKAGGERYAVGVRDDKLVLTHPNPDDLTQQWCKDERYSTKVKDKDGYPSFILVNKGTAQAVKHSVSCHPVQLTPYNPDVFDESVLWTESKDLGSGFRSIRTVNNIHLVMDAWNADKDHGGIHDGTYIALYETWKGDNQNQQWKFIRH